MAQGISPFGDFTFRLNDYSYQSRLYQDLLNYSQYITFCKICQPQKLFYPKMIVIFVHFVQLQSN